ncbi:methyltransferase domain-containing protein [Allofranklinella schreckenbergeri]|uniref:Methyltransferase domain-containing protein n=1 Tax=Allofranklinella schreckenbergeri TaxID=1076744 RepID=A0A3M6Q9V0_9BURK|nr:methyltransferase domain-containing protein [Allofranklinella schreckenbergeri]RMW99716.1 methyltransferase domain-containing protein [Allofranklinella schreckenbergeri]
MTLSKDEMHVYLRHIDEGERTSLSVLVGKIGSGASVLDVGCGSGALGQYLHEHRQCTVDGVTFNAAEAEMARASYRKVEVADLERSPLTQLFPGMRYDCIVCADVLEHLRQPEAMLRDMAALLNEGGQLLISIPNTAYAGLLAELMEGEFLYREEGLLDATHVRHVTRKSLLRLLEQAGWQVTALEVIERALQESEFKTPFDRLPPAVARHLLARGDALTYQFIATAQPAAQPDNRRFVLQHEPGEEAGEGALQPQALFSAQLYWDEGQGWAEERKCVQAGVIGLPRQTLTFALPPLGGLRALKFDPADRPGILYLYGMRLLRAPEHPDAHASEAQAPLWAWHSSDADAAELLKTASTHEMVWGDAVLGRASDAGGLPAILAGSDPWLVLPLPAAIASELDAAAARGPLVLEVELGWPMSADYISLVSVVGPLRAEQQHLRERQAQQWQQMQHISQEHEKLALEHAQLHHAHADVLRQRDEAQRRLERALGEAQHIFGERERAQAEVADLHQQLRGMVEHLENMRNSRVFRYTRPIVKLRDMLKRRPAPAQKPDEQPAAPAAPSTGAHEALAASAPGPAQAVPTSLDGKPTDDSVSMDTAATSAAEAVAQGEPAAAPAPQPQGEARSDTVDIIVPVYRGLADTQLCVESVLAAPVATPYRLIVINDCSPEPEVTAWLREKAAGEPRITLLENEHNLGFVGTVNRGMRHSGDNDVLLLNSDTEVANDWLDRLRQAAYRPLPAEGAPAQGQANAPSGMPAGARAGTVTPFSSNATICSYPDFCRDNPLPPGQSTASLDRLFATANAGQSVEVPTGVGFCMYIRRDCLDEVGLFDEEHFGKGYGEENDFCQRAIAKGWRNLHALDAYVLHTGGVSFGESKSPREQAAMQTLRRLHPDYEWQVHDFVRRDPARAARLAVDWLRATDGARLPVILAVHHQRGGGTERHVLELAQTLAGQATFVSLRPAGAQQVCVQLIEPQAPDGHYSLSPRWSAQFDTVRERDALLQLLAALPVAHIHYHHLLGHDKLAWELPQLLGVGYDVTAHDFYSYCTNVTMTGRKGRYEVDAQGECCGGVHPAPIPAVEANVRGWRIRNRLLLEGARHVLAPSLDTAQRMHHFAPKAHIRFAPHTDVDLAALPQPQPRPLGEDAPLRIVVIGALSAIKGADVLEEAALQARRQGLPLEFHLIGYAYRHLQTQPASALHVHGQYDERDLPAILQRLHPDLVWLPAQWPETYSYTLSAALQQGCPVAVPDLGAFAARVADRPWSWVRPWDWSAQQWLEFFVDVRQRHFLPGQPPECVPMPPELSEAEQQWGGWSYPQDYLPAPARAEGMTPIEALHRVAQALVQATRYGHPGAEAAARGLRGVALRQLARLRAMPVMRPLVRAISPQMQARVKSWLQR